MDYNTIIENTRDALEEFFPELDYTSIDMEGANIIVYSKESDRFFEDPEKIKKMAQKLKRRVVVRPDSSVLISEEEAEEIIRKIIPRDIKISDIFFENDTGEVLIELDDPETVMDPQKPYISEIRKAVKWAPRIIRTPPIEVPRLKW